MTINKEYFMISNIAMTFKYLTNYNADKCIIIIGKIELDI